MAKDTNSPVGQEGGYGTDLAVVGAEEREHMIQEAAYYRYVEHGFVHGHDLDDWLAAEAEFDRRRTGEKRPVPSEAPEYEVQQSGVLSPSEDEALKRLIRQHPGRAIPKVEGV
jgi:Protein of unknown function (DUF2934)